MQNALITFPRALALGAFRVPLGLQRGPTFRRGLVIAPNQTLGISGAASAEVSALGFPSLMVWRPNGSGLWGLCAAIAREPNQRDPGVDLELFEDVSQMSVDGVW